MVAAETDPFDFGIEGAKASVALLLQKQAEVVGREIVILLELGFVDGAFARWRTLHEIAVIMAVLDVNNNELAVRFWNYSRWQAVLDVKAFNTARAKYGLPELLTEEAEEVKSALREQYGPEFCTPYGWAKTLKGVSNFRDLEQLVDDSSRVFYQTASNLVHLSSRTVIDPILLSRQEAARSRSFEWMPVVVQCVARSLRKCCESFSRIVLEFKGSDPDVNIAIGLLATLTTELENACITAVNIAEMDPTASDPWLDGELWV